MNQPSRITLESLTTGHGVPATWQSAHQWRAPTQFEIAPPEMQADQAHRLVSQGVGLIWKNDFHQGRQLLQAIKRRLNQKSQRFATLALPERFHRLRMQRSQIARQAGLLLVKVAPGYELECSRAPDIRQACQSAYGQTLIEKGFVVPLTELNGVLSAYQWQLRGLPVAALGQTIYSRWGVFAPTRHEYLDLVMQAPLPDICQRAVDVGTGTGVLAMILAKRGIDRIYATDINQAALMCARQNVAKLGLQAQIEVLETNFIPKGTFDLLICNPPWLPGAASGPLEAAVYDPQHRMLRGFLNQAASHLNPLGQAWLILSDLAERLKLRSRQDLLQWIDQAGLRVLDRADTKPSHRKLSDDQDPLALERNQEVTSLWRLSSSA